MAVAAMCSQGSGVGKRNRFNPLLARCIQHLHLRLRTRQENFDTFDEKKWAHSNFKVRERDREGEVSKSRTGTAIALQ